MVFPGFFKTIEYSIYLLKSSYTYKCIFETMVKMLMGFGISFIIALVLGTLSGNYEYIYEFLKPLITTLKAIPTASLIYLFIVLAGFKKAPMILVSIVCFPILYEGVVGGIKNVDKDIIDSARIDGANLFNLNRYIKLPLATSYILVAIASSFSLSFKIEIMAEVITGASNAGLGAAILGARSSDPTNMVPVFGYSFIAVVIMLVIDYLAKVIENIFNK